MWPAQQRTREESPGRRIPFICMLAYYIEWHMREKLRPVLFADDDQESAAQARESIVAPAGRSASAQHKDATRRNRIRVSEFDSEFDKLTLATPYQQHVLDLLGVAT